MLLLARAGPHNREAKNMQHQRCHTANQKTRSETNEMPAPTNLITTRARARTAFDAVAAAIETHAGIRAHLGKLKAWSPTGGPAPTDLATLGPDVWRSDRPAHENGLVVLGTPLGSREFIEAHGQTRMEEEHRLLNETLAWDPLSYSPVPRVNQLLNIHDPPFTMMLSGAPSASSWEQTRAKQTPQHAPSRRFPSDWVAWVPAAQHAPAPLLTGPPGPTLFPCWPRRSQPWPTLSQPTSTTAATPATDWPKPQLQQTSSDQKDSPDAHLGVHPGRHSPSAGLSWS